MDSKALIQVLDSLALTLKPKPHQRLSQLTSIAVGGPALALVEPSNQAELEALIKTAQRFDCPWFILGRGTNLLAPDQGFNGLVIRLAGEFEQITVNDNLLIAGAAAKDRRLARAARNHGLSGLEFLGGIPGCLGGALWMNAGAQGNCMAEVTEWVEFFDPNQGVLKLNSKELEFSYRQSWFMRHQGVILKAGLKLTAKDPSLIAATEEEFSQKRKASQPLEAKSFGSVFKNPKGDSAGRLIESLGLKGKRIGGARISPKHANFIENMGNASFADLMKTIALIQEMVSNAYDIELETEGVFIPNDSPTED